MPYKFNPITGKLDLVNKETKIQLDDTNNKIIFWVKGVKRVELDVDGNCRLSGNMIEGVNNISYTNIGEVIELFNKNVRTLVVNSDMMVSGQFKEGQSLTGSSATKTVYIYDRTNNNWEFFINYNLIAQSDENGNFSIEGTFTESASL